MLGLVAQDRPCDGHCLARREDGPLRRALLAQAQRICRPGTGYENHRQRQDEENASPANLPYPVGGRRLAARRAAMKRSSWNPLDHSSRLGRAFRPVLAVRNGVWPASHRPTRPAHPGNAEFHGQSLADSPRGPSEPAAGSRSISAKTHGTNGRRVATRNTAAAIRRAADKPAGIGG